MSGINRVTILGHLAADPEMKNTNGRNALVTFRVGVTETWGKGSERKERTEWVSVKCWGDALGDIVMNNLRKGSKVYVEGKLQTEMFERNGEKRYSTFLVVQGFDGKIEFMSAPAGGTGTGRRDDGQGGGGRAAAPPPPSGGGIDYDDEIPFAPEFR